MYQPPYHTPTLIEEHSSWSDHPDQLPLLLDLIMMIQGDGPDQRWRKQGQISSPTEEISDEVRQGRSSWIGTGNNNHNGPRHIFRLLPHVDVNICIVWRLGPVISCYQDFSNSLERKKSWCQKWGSVSLLKSWSPKILVKNLASFGQCKSMHCNDRTLV